MLLRTSSSRSCCTYKQHLVLVSISAYAVMITTSRFESFGQDDLTGVAGRLEAMVGTMEVLKDMPEAEDRAATLRELQERLEALLKPKLLEVRPV